MAYIQVISATESSIQVQMAGLDTSYHLTDRVCYWYLDGTYQGRTTLGAYVSSGGAYVFRGLEAGTLYEIYVAIEFDNGTMVDFYTTAETEDPMYYYVRVSFYANGGTGAPATMEDSGTSATTNLTIPSKAPTREGYTFLGWSENPAATAPDYLAGRTYAFYMSTSTRTYSLYAVWLKTDTGGWVYLCRNGAWRRHGVYIYQNRWNRYGTYLHRDGWEKTK